MNALSLFTGVGGLDLAAQAAGISVSAMCEVDPFCRTILAKRFPLVPVIDDIRNVDGERFRGKIDIVFGGFPCQDLSIARVNYGRKGLGGERSGLWFEMARVIREAGPSWVLAENVLGAVSLALDTITENLETAGYEVRSLVLPAFAYGAPHYRKRLFVCAARKGLADSCRDGLQAYGKLPDADEARGESVRAWSFNHDGTHRARDGGGAKPGGSRRLVNPDWAEQLMAFPEGWTNPEVDDPAPWRGFPMRARLRRDGSGGWTSPQFPYEFPRLAPKGQWTERRLKAIGNAVCPVQAYPLFRAIAFMHDALQGC